MRILPAIILILLATTFIVGIYIMMRDVPVDKKTVNEPIPNERFFPEEPA